MMMTRCWLLLSFYVDLISSCKSALEVLASQTQDMNGDFKYFCIIGCKPAGGRAVTRVLPCNPCSPSKENLEFFAAWGGVSDVPPRSPQTADFPLGHIDTTGNPHDP